MFCDQMRAAIEEARTLTRLDALSAAVWKGWSAGAVTDEEAQRLAELVHARKIVVRGEIKPVGIPLGRATIFPVRRVQRAPKRAAAIVRRRHLAVSGPMPPALASHFTVGELAVLNIVGDEVRLNGQCDRTVDEIAARAGCCRRLAQNAIRLAAGLGLLTIQERRRQGQKNLPNIIRVVSGEWLAWIKTRSRATRAKSGEGIGCKKIHPTDNKVNHREERTAQRPIAAGGQQAKPEAPRSGIVAGGGSGLRASGGAHG